MTAPRRGAAAGVDFAQTVPVRRLLVVLLALVLAPLGLATPASAAGTGTVSGRATDSGGAPLGGVKVYISSWSTDAEGEATTGDDGTFSVSNLPAGNWYSVCFQPKEATGGSSPTGYRDTCWQDVDSTDGVSGSELTFVTVPDGGVASGIVQALPSTGAVSGTVTDEHGTPLAGAVVTAVSGPGSQASARGKATTDSEGRYVIDRLRPRSDYSVCVAGEGVDGGWSAVGYLDNCHGDVPPQFGYTPHTSDYPTLDVVAESTTAVDPIRLDAAVRVEGTLTNANGQPVAGVKVQGDRGGAGMAVNARAVTDSNGHYVLSVDGEAGGWANGMYSGTRLPSGPYEIYYNTYDVPQYVPQRYQGVLTAYGKTFGGTPAIVTPAPGAATTVDDQLSRAATIAGTVTDKQGSGLAGVSVRLSNDGDHLTETHTDESGHYSFDKLPAGTYELCYEASSVWGGSSTAGYLDSCGDPVTVDSGQHRTGVDDVLQAASGISGTLFGPSFEPLAYRTVHLYYDGSSGQPASGSTNAEGKFLFRRLPAGTYKVCFKVYSPAWEGCYHGAADVASATPITTTLGSVVTGINGQMTATPDITAPTASMTKPVTLVQTSRTIALGVATSDDESGVASYDLRYRYADWNDRAFSAYVSPASWRARTAAAPTMTGVPGRTYCFSVRARDTVDNTSGYSAERCATVPLDDRALTRASGTWRRVTSPNAYGNTVTRTSEYGATLTLAGAHVDRVGLVVTTCPTCGRASVLVNGRPLVTFSTWSSVTRKKVLYLPRTFTYRRAAISVRLEQRNRWLVVDGLAATRR